MIFYGSEKSHTLTKADEIKILLKATNGEEVVLKEGLKLLEGEIIDVSTMSVSALRDFFKKAIAESKAEGVLFSLHMKATMMKVSDPIIFGHGVETFFEACICKI